MDRIGGADWYSPMITMKMGQTWIDKMDRIRD
jgi:hypothetical protein